MAAAIWSGGKDRVGEHVAAEGAPKSQAGDVPAVPTAK
jgi:hypothetical protein